MRINVTITRSVDWVKQQRVVTGENVPVELACEVEVAELSPEARASLIARYGEFRAVKCAYSRFAENEPFRADSDSPSAAGVSAAICHAHEVVLDREAKIRVERVERQAQAEAEKARIAAREAELTAARELLGNEIRGLLERVCQAEADRALLGEFLHQIPDDALRGALREWVAESEVPVKRQAIENASPSQVFGDD